jgi:thioesterase CepJ
MPSVTFARGTADEVEIAYDEFGDANGDPLLLIAGCGQPAIAWQVGVVAALAGAGYRVVTYDNRGVTPSSSPPAPYSVDQMVGDALALLDHLEIPVARIAGHSMGGWIAEVIAARHPERVRAAAFLGSCNPPTSWEKAITTVERDLARLDYDLPPLFYATETMRYLPNKDLQDDTLVDTFLMFTGEQEPWPNPGRLGQYEAALAWSTDPDHGAGWAQISVPCLIMAYEHDVDSPPQRAREAAAIIPGARYVEIADTSHLAPFTHGDAVGGVLVEFFATA